MLNPKVAEERLKEFSTEKPQEKQRERIATLPEALRVAALALIGLKPDGTAFVTVQDWREAHKQREAQQKAMEAAFQFSGYTSHCRARDILRGVLSSPGIPAGPLVEIRRRDAIPGKLQSPPLPYFSNRAVRRSPTGAASDMEHAFK